MLYHVTHTLATTVFVIQSAGKVIADHKETVRSIKRQLMEREKQQCMWHKTRQWIVNEFKSSRKKCTDLSTETLSGEIEDCRQCSWSHSSRRERERNKTDIRQRFHVFYSISNHADGSIVLGFISCESAVMNIFERAVQPLQLLQVCPRCWWSPADPTQGYKRDLMKHKRSPGKQI